MTAPQKPPVDGADTGSRVAAANGRSRAPNAKHPRRALRLVPWVGRGRPRGDDTRPPFAPSRHRDDLQGLRAVAVLLVALSHAGVGFLKGGFVGVDVFFVLSGFLITGLLLSEAVNRGSVSLLNFYARRARRILPAAALTLVTTTIVAYELLNFVR